ncbi:MAG: AAA family ATPase [Nitrospiraceae bacterium]|nr:MAG: AAA family ATPase [Nitrospiraceae bacterium]
MQSNSVSVGLEIKNEQVKSELIEIISSIAGFRVMKFLDQEDCDIIVLEIGDDPEKEFQCIHSLHDADANKGVFLTSSRTEPEILLRALRAGAKEFFTQPLKREEIINAFGKFREKKVYAPSNGNGKKKGKIINVLGSKGGIGTTTISVNLALSLLASPNDNQTSVAIMDLNLLFGEVPIFLGLKPVFSWGEIVQNISRLDSTYLKSVMAKHDSGMHILPSPSQFDGITVANSEIIGKILQLMLKEYDYIVIDSGQSLDDMSLKVLELSDTVLINSILSLPCLINCKRLLESFWRMGYPRNEHIKIIINRYHKNSDISLKDAEKGIQRNIFWTIPNEYQLTMSAINQGKPLTAMSNKSDITRKIRNLAAACLKDMNTIKNETYHVPEPNLSGIRS